MVASTSATNGPGEQTFGQGQDTDDFPDITTLKEIARDSLVLSLNSVVGAKTLVLDPSLAGPLSLVAEVSLLQQHGVDKMFWLEQGPLTAATTNIVYLCRPHIKWMKVIADQIKRHGRENRQHTYTLLLVPRTSTIVSRVLEDEGVLGDVTIAAYDLQFIPIADDVVSLETDGAFKEIWVDGDETAVYNSAQALHSLQKLFGLFPRILGKGDVAGRLADLLVKQTSHGVLSSANGAPVLSDKFDCLIVLDRKADMVTPLLTQLTFEGLIDEVIGIKNSHIEVPASLVSAPSNPAAPPTASATPSTAAALAREKRRKHRLAAETDPIFSELRDLNFAAVGKRLNRVARKLDEEYKARHKAQTPAQLRDFVGKLGSLETEKQSLRLHTGLSEMLLPFTRSEVFKKALEIQQNLLDSYDVPGQITAVEDLLSQGADMQLVTRLLCLASITAGGIKSKTLENIKREFLQVKIPAPFKIRFVPLTRGTETYGYNFLPLLLSLASPPLGVLLPNPLPSSSSAEYTSSKYPYVSLRKSLRLVIDGDESLEELENDISYVYSGYAPISVRLVQCVVQKGGVLSNPAAGKDKAAAEDDSTAGKPAVKMQAHPIVGFKGFEDVVASIPGRTVDVMQQPLGGNDAASVSLPSSHERSTTTVVFFLGGCTYTEIAALRWAGRQNQGRKLLIATSGILVYPPSTPTMPPRAKKTADSEKPARKAKSSGGPRKKLTPFNKFMQTELARLKEEKPELSHQERFKLATSNWKTAKESKA
ncbi:Sec1-like protein [Vararia minispora EC-137]|uniref:Sec1-like protein n=1 Tax=Vararia minispora EC-137 TaxID=1314806 RepID=A0ACB8Q9P6_9AGAM|nr:Sec1-like protein [Vararia minispora EC-137]